MKKKMNARSLVVAATALLTAQPALLLAEDSPAVDPTGELHVDRNYARTGARPKLEWKVTYPVKIEDLVEIEDGTVTPKKDLMMEVRVVGVAFGNGSRDLPVRLEAKTGRSSWNEVFFGFARDVNASVPVMGPRKVEKDQTIDFRGMGYNAKTVTKRVGGRWVQETVYDGIDLIATNDSRKREYVTALSNGQLVPQYSGAYDQGNVEDYLTHYIDRNNRVTIGPRDVIYLFELGGGSPPSKRPDGSYYPSQSAFDMQDIVVVVTFNEVDAD